MQITVKVPGSCGELAQGLFKDEPFLITCPIDIFSAVTVSDKFSDVSDLGWKSQIMLKKTLDYIGVKRFKFGVRLKSELPTAKGMASSSADLAAIAKAVSLAFNIELTPYEICKLAVQIEPTDATFVDGIVAMNPINGEIWKNFAPIPNYKIAIFDFGGTVNTLELNSRSDFRLNELPKSITSDLMIKSALANQHILHKMELGSIIDFAMKNGAISVNIAHSGTVIGIFFDNISIINSISERFKHIKFLCIAKLISGGFWIKN